MAHTHLHFLIPLLLLSLLALPCGALAEEAAAPAAERYVELSTEYPALTAKAGDGSILLGSEVRP